MAIKFSEFALSPEASKLIRHQFEIDFEAAGPKSPMDYRMHKGVCLISRWSVISELELMADAIDNIPEILVRRIKSVWCDSNCGSNYVVTTKTNGGNPALVTAIATAFKINTIKNIWVRRSPSSGASKPLSLAARCWSWLTNPERSSRRNKTPHKRMITSPK